MGISKRAYSDKRLAELNEKNIEYNGNKYTEYEISQMQRSMERSIRKTKRRIIAADTGRQNADSDELKQAFDNEFTKQSVKLKAKEEKLNDFLHKTGTLPDNARTQVVGFGRSVAQKAVWAKKKVLDKYTKLHYNKDGTIIVTDDWTAKGKVTIPKKYKPFAVIESQTTYKNGSIQKERTIYDENAMMKIQIHSGDHCKPKQHPYGINGEHHHYYTWIDGEEHPIRTTDELTDTERKEHSDIL